MPIVSPQDIIFNREENDTSIVSEEDIIFNEPSIVSPENIIFSDNGGGQFRGAGASGGFEKTGVWPAMKSGMASSIQGMMTNQGLPKPYEPEGIVERTAQGIGQLAGDLPYYVIGGGLGGPIGTFALPAGIRKVLVNAYSEGQAKTWEDFKSLAGGALKETGKGAIVGATVGMAGKYAPTLKGISTKFPTEVGAMVTTGSAVEGQIPKLQDFVDASVLIGTLHGVNITAKMLQNHYARTGEHPMQVAQKTVESKDVMERKIPRIIEAPAQETIPEKVIEPSPKSGVDLIAYHGTDQVYNIPDVGKLGSTTKSRSSKEARFLSLDPRVAESYAKSAKYYRGSEILEAALKEKRSLYNPLTGKTTNRARYEELEKIITAEESRMLSDIGGANIRTEKVHLDNPYTIDMKGVAAGKWEGEHGDFTETLKWAKAEGYDGVIYKNTFEGGLDVKGKDIIADNVAIFPKLTSKGKRSEASTKGYQTRFKDKVFLKEEQITPAMGIIRRFGNYKGEAESFNNVIVGVGKRKIGSKKFTEPSLADNRDKAVYTYNEISDTNPDLNMGRVESYDEIMNIAQQDLMKVSGGKTAKQIREEETAYMGYTKEQVEAMAEAMDTDYNKSVKESGHAKEDIGRIERDADKIVEIEIQPLVETKKVAVEEYQDYLNEQKYAQSVNLERQIISESAKLAELEMAKPKTVLTNKEADKIIANELKKLSDANYYKTQITKIKNGETPHKEVEQAFREINAKNFEDFKSASISFQKGEIILDDFRNIEATRADTFDNVVNPLASDAGRRLQLYNKEIGSQRAQKAISSLKKQLNERQIQELSMVDWDNPRSVNKFIERLPDPKLMEYVYEFWYNSILSGIPTHVVNVVSNTAWSAFQIPHRGLVGGVDTMISKLTGRPKRVYMQEIIPMMTGYEKGFKPGAGAAWQVMKTGNLQDIETKWDIDIGSKNISAFERSPNKFVRAMTPATSGFLRALQAMDVWAKSMGADAQMNALAKRESLKMGLKGDVAKAFEKNLLQNPTEAMLNDAKSYARYVVFADRPGAFTRWVIKGRDIVPGGRFIIPFVNTISNLTQRGMEKTPGLGLAFEGYRKVSGQKMLPAEEVIANQIEGSLLALYILYKCDAGEITGAAPREKAERDAFYREGKIPWGIRIGDNWYQYRRIEPFNTPVAMVAITYDKIKNAKDDETATTIFGNTVRGLSENLIDSGYLQGVSNLLDRYGGQKGMAQRQLASFVPYSSFWRSVNRSYEVLTEGSTKVRETNSMMGALSQVIPGLSRYIPPKINVWGEDIIMPGGVFRQWLPYKYAEQSTDPVEIEFQRLEYYPGLPGKNVTINKKEVELDDIAYGNYCLSYGSKAKKEMSRIISSDWYKNSTNDEMKLKILDKVMTKIRNDELKRAKLNQLKHGK